MVNKMSPVELPLSATVSRFSNIYRKSEIVAVRKGGVGSEMRCEMDEMSGSKCWARRKGYEMRSCCNSTKASFLTDEL